MTERRPYTPRPYQPLMGEHIINHPRCAVWAGMGLGKGVGTLTALDELSIVEDVYPALVVGPLRVARDVWPRECEKWDHLAHLTCVPIIGNPEERLSAIRVESSIYSINYENLPWLLAYWGEDRWPYKTVISDESTKLKGYRGSYRTHPVTGKVFLQGAGGARTRALAKVTHGGVVTRFIQLTGTPAPNGLKDLWGQIWFLDSGARLGRTYEGFTDRWFSSKRNGPSVQYTPTKSADREIHEKVADLCLTIDAKDYFDLKQPIVNNIMVVLPATARKHYKEMEKDMFTSLGEDTVEAFGAAARTQKCLQLANGAVYVDPEATTDAHPKSRKWSQVHDAKMEALDSCIEEACGAPMIVSYEFRSDLARILKAYPKAVDLSTPTGMKQFLKGDVAVGLGHPQSIGHGVDGLQDVCNIITFFGHNWNLETYDQIIGRIGPVRQIQAGFDRPVFINHIIAADTVDELVMERRDGKREVQDILLDAMKRRGAR